ncbi:MAG: pyridoxal-phosphate dependent enzyme [Oscillospiraceae bacterium]|jgi:cysteine synthase A|nr:pyridoxal-phosphate dependent enzyme [Oscillospiraceae bacterium]
MSIERRKIVNALGAEVVLTPRHLRMKAAIDKAQELQKTYGNAFISQQFETAANPDIQQKTTAQEIWDATDGRVDFFVSAVGTGGTVTGTGRDLKEKNPDVQVIAVEPAASPGLSGGKPGPHAIQGIGAGFIPKVMDTRLVDKIITVENEDAFDHSREVAKSDGLLVSFSAGAAIDAGLQLAQRPKHNCGTAGGRRRRCLSTSLYK